MNTLKLPTGEAIAKLGLGTWYMGENAARFERETDAVRYALERGVRLIDTAEMYGDGGAEEVVGAAIRKAGIARGDITVVSKVLPSNAHYDGVMRACEDSLHRLQSDYIDLYLLHWRGGTPFQETLDAFADLQASGRIRHFGVSNFDGTDMKEWLACTGGDKTATNQILYNLSRRGPEWDLLGLCRAAGMPVTAYSPLEQGRLALDPALADVAQRHGVAPLQIALAWVLRQDNVLAIPKAVEHAHIDQNIAAADIVLSPKDLAALDLAFPPPAGPSHLEML